MHLHNFLCCRTIYPNIIEKWGFRSGKSGLATSDTQLYCSCAKGSNGIDNVQTHQGKVGNLFFAISNIKLPACGFVIVGLCRPPNSHISQMQNKHGATFHFKTSCTSS